jgi:hypothetical protein
MLAHLTQDRMIHGESNKIQRPTDNRLHYFSCPYFGAARESCHERRPKERMDEESGRSLKAFPLFAASAAAAQNWSDLLLHAQVQT